MQIYFLRISQGVVEYSDEISEDLLLSYDCDNKIAAVELYFVSKLLHVFSVKGKPHFIINPIYYEDSDILKIRFSNFTPHVIIKKTEVEDIEVGVDNAGKIVSLLFYNASNRVLKTLSEEERVNRKKRGDEIQKSIQKFLGRI